MYVRKQNTKAEYGLRKRSALRNKHIIPFTWF
uniref:Uncharacterized protein n=1 Tax=Anguilla anguilla TaxID=7936 RepID=A0A0E9T6W9_ANGAN